MSLVTVLVLGGDCGRLLWVCRCISYELKEYQSQMLVTAIDLLCDRTNRIHLR